MGNWWITFSDRQPACAAMVSREEAQKMGEEVGEVIRIETLPYPASPRLDKNDGWGDGQVPSFCYKPEKCKGRTSCPQCPSCVD